MAIPELKLPPAVYTVDKHTGSFFLYEYKPQRDKGCKIL